VIRYGLYAAGLCVVFLRSPLAAIVSLIVAFLLLAVMTLSLGLEFMSLLLIFVYIGSLSILFLFAAVFLDLWSCQPEFVVLRGGCILPCLCSASVLAFTTKRLELAEATFLSTGSRACP
jgi:NADH:ubiquinone oxidoreductase subunit 6 (subunit J)